ncbi:MAG: MATE family efflux transporter [Clostridia bacterium]|nr:MATE family efflux transporter [Clostridia bacterium]
METKRPFWKKFIGDRAFYGTVLAVAVPMMVQNAFTQFVSLLDNIMVGRVGTDQMSGVAIANQLVFVFSLCIFGALSGVGIFTAQFYGKGDDAGIRRTAKVKLVLAVVLSVLFAVVFTFWGEPIIRLFLHEGSESGDLAATLAYGMEYLMWCRWLLLPFALVQVYASTLRETAVTKPPMVAGIVAVFVNLAFNYLLIFGKCGFPALGVSGAAIATIVSRLVEFGLVAGWTHRHSDTNRFAVGLWKPERIPMPLLRDIAVKGTPLMVNELLWSSGMTILNQCYSTRGLATVAAVNINAVMSQLFNVVFMALGSSIGIVVGNLLGANRMKEARETDTKMLFFTVASCAVMGTAMFFFAPLFPKFYNTTDEVRLLAEEMLRITALIMPFHAFTHGCYFTLRSGGKTFITFLFDSTWLWAVTVTGAMLIAQKTAMPIIPFFAIITASECLKCVVGYLLVRTDIWMNNIVGETR